MAKKNKPEGKKYSYMDTYGDLVTLLLCFFVLLFSMSTVEEQKFNAFVEGLNGRFGSQIKVATANPETDSGSGQGPDDPEGENVNPEQDLPADLQMLSEALEEYIEENNLQESISINKSESGATFIRLSGNLLFAGDDAKLLPPLREFLNFLSDSLVEVEKEILQVRFLGHTATDSTSPQNDWLLSARRAGEVSNYVSGRGFTPYKISSQFFGKYYPVADNATAAGKATNRRVDIVILSNDADKMILTLADAMRVYFPDDDTEFFTGAPEELPDNALQNISPVDDGGTVISVPGMPESAGSTPTNGSSAP